MNCASTLWSNNRTSIGFNTVTTKSVNKVMALCDGRPGKFTKTFNGGFNLLLSFWIENRFRGFLIKYYTKPVLSSKTANVISFKRNIHGRTHIANDAVILKTVLLIH